MSSEARILDRGYRPYEGPRTGPATAVQAVARNTAARCLGLRRRFTAKIFPVLAAFIAFVPALVFVGLAVVLPDQIRQSATAAYEDYYGNITLAIVIFTAFVTPEALGPDRRSGLLGLYLAAPLTRSTYLVAKALGVVAVLVVVTAGPVLLLLFGNTFVGVGPDGLGGWLVTLGRVLGAGLVLAAVYGSVGLAVAALTDRRAVAAAGVVLVLLVSAISTVFAIQDLSAPDWVLAFNLVAMPLEAVRHLYGAGPSPNDPASLGAAASLLAAAGWTLAGAAVLWVRYRRLAVTR